MGLKKKKKLIKYESFGWILQKIEFICDIGAVKSYLANWGEKQISTT